MKIYSIVRIGDEYVVRAGETSILKVASRRRAAQIITDAVELLDSQNTPPLSPQAPGEPSTGCDPDVTPDPPEVP
jgi:hypothetical protein